MITVETAVVMTPAVVIDFLMLRDAQTILKKQPVHLEATTKSFVSAN
jgi:hypothetical protein